MTSDFHRFDHQYSGIDQGAGGKEPLLCRRQRKDGHQLVTQWTERREQRLKELWADGHTARAIAGTLNAETGSSFTKNAVLGKVDRLELPPNSQSRPRLSEEQRINLRRARHERWRRSKGIQPRGVYQLRKKKEPTALLVVVMDSQIPIEQRRSLVELGNQHCRWPVGEPGSSDFFFCGAPEADLIGGIPYCSTHTWRGQQTSTPKRAA